MAEHTVNSLINMLKEFPQDLPIANEISVIWFFPDEIREKEDEYTQEEFARLTRKYASDICIFEGSWANDTIVDQDKTMEKLVEKYKTLEDEEE